MKRVRYLTMGMVAALVLAADGTETQANIAINTVPVGDLSNAGELSGAGVGGYGPDRVCGAVNYAYRIGTYEATAGQYTAFLNAVAKADPYGLYNTSMWSNGYGCKINRSGSSGSYSYSVTADYANRPVNFVSWGDAARFANWLHNGQPTGAQDASTTEDGSYFLNGAKTDAALLGVMRQSSATWVIASEDEWYKAAYYKGGSGDAGYWDYPTANDMVPGRDIADASGNNANYNGTPFPLDAPYYTTTAGEFQNSASAYGTFDQGGNLWEWNEAVIGSSRGLRGGSFYSSNTTLLASSRYYIAPTNELDNVGFRLALLPEPTMLSLLALGSMVVLKRNRRRISL